MMPRPLTTTKNPAPNENASCDDVTVAAVETA